MMIEPELSCSVVPTDDALSDGMKMLYDLSQSPQDRCYKGIHVCSCGQCSDNRDHFLPSGRITNSLAVHYMRHHREEVPESELQKLKDDLRQFLELVSREGVQSVD